MEDRQTARVTRVVNRPRNAKAGDVASGPRGKAETLRTRAREAMLESRGGSAMAVPWRVARGSWRREDRDEELLFEIEGQRSPETRSQLATGARQKERLSARGFAEGLMKHVPNGREERKTARERTQGPVKKNSRSRDPRTHERKEHSQMQARKSSINVLKWKSLCPDRLWLHCSSNVEGCV